MTHLCVSIFVTDLAQAQRDIAAAAEAGADLVELRIDTFTSQPEITELLRGCGLPQIVTCRPVWEGGHCELPESERLEILEFAARSGATYVDVELETYRRQSAIQDLVHLYPREKRPGLIVSSHDFLTRPPRLVNLFDELEQSAGRRQQDCLDCPHGARQSRGV